MKFKFSGGNIRRDLANDAPDFAQSCPKPLAPRERQKFLVRVRVVKPEQTENEVFQASLWCMPALLTTRCISSPNDASGDPIKRRALAKNGNVASLLGLTLNALNKIMCAQCVAFGEDFQHKTMENATLVEGNIGPARVVSDH